MKRATLKDVAERAGVSKATVSYILNNTKKSISPETRERVQRAIEELEYIPNLGAAALTSNCSRLIGVVVPQTEPGSELMFQNSFYSEILSAIEYGARQRGYHVIISGTDVDESYMKLVVERSLDGVIVIGMFPDDFYRQFKKIEVPVVLIDSYCKDRYFHNIRIDDELGGYTGTKYMLGRGHTRVGILCGHRHDNGVVQKRIDGYRRALAESGIAFDERLVFEDNVDYASGVRAARRIAREKLPLTGLVATADVLAIGAVKGFAQAGAAVPEDYSVIGFDDLEITAYMNPGLTTVHQDIARKGELAIELLAESIGESEYEREDIVLPFRIVERESVAVPAGGAAGEKMEK